MNLPFLRGARSAARIDLTSVTRWLLVVVGCTGLELVQPALAADPAGAAESAQTQVQTQTAEERERADDTVLYPKRSDADAVSPAARERSFANSGWVVVGFLLVAGGAWLWWQRRRLAARPGGRELIGIEGTRSLGNRQFLVVASCDGRRLLLGVSPGRISTLAELDDAADADAGGGEAAAAVVSHTAYRSRLEPVTFSQ